MLAGTLGVLVLVLALLALAPARVAASLLGDRGAGGRVGVFARTCAAYACWPALSRRRRDRVAAVRGVRWSNRDLARQRRWRWRSIIFQAMLGMWTVTLLLKPVVVMGHLLGGMTDVRAARVRALRLRPTCRPHWRDARCCAALLIARHRAARVPDRARRLDQRRTTPRSPAAPIFRNASANGGRRRISTKGFVLWRGIGVNYEGGVLDARGAQRDPARASDRWRWSCSAISRWLRAPAARARARAGSAIALGVLLLAQVSLGIGNVKLGLPLHGRGAHNGVAALLLFVLVGTGSRASARRMP